MQINNGDKLVVKKKLSGFFNEGDIVKVTEVRDNGMVSFVFGKDFASTGFMDSDTCKEHFEKVEETAEPESFVVPWELIEEILDNSDFHAYTTFDKCTTVSCLLPNGYVITESNICANPEHYDKDAEFNVCWDKISYKLYELETYRLHEELYRASNNDCGNCDECPCDYCCEDEFDECLDTDLDCDDCDDYDCPNNPNRMFS